MPRLNDRHVAAAKRYSPFEIPPQDILALAQQIGLDEECTARLALGAYAMVGWHLMPKLLLATADDPVAGRERLARIAQFADLLNAELEGLGPIHAMLMTEVASEAAHGNDQPMSPMALKRELERQSQIALETRSRIGIRNPGAQTDSLSPITMRQLVRITELATGQPVRASKTRNSVYDPHLLGRGGAFIEAWFDRVDPTVGSTARRRLLVTAKRKLQEPGVAQEDAEWLRLCELALLSNVAFTI